MLNSQRGKPQSIRSANLLRAIIATSSFCILFSIASCARPPRAAQNGPPPFLEFLGSWGKSGTNPGAFQQPRAISVDSVGNLYIADDGKPARVEKFDPQGHPLLVFDLIGNQNDWDLAVDPGNAIFVLDVARSQVQIFSPEGKIFRTLLFRYRRAFKRPSSFAMEPDGDFYVADSKAGRIVELNARGRTQRTFMKPASMPVDRWSPLQVRLDPEGNLYVADNANGKIEKLASDGRYLASWDFPFNDASPNRQSMKSGGIAVSANCVVASDATKRLLEIWSTDGAAKMTADFSRHPEWGEHATPTDVALYRDSLFVLDGAENRVLRFKINSAASQLAPSNP